MRSTIDIAENLRSMKLYHLVILSLLSALILSSCGVSKTYISTIRPPDLDLSRDIERIVILNRSLPANKSIGFLEGLATGESIGQDPFARKAIFESLRDIMKDQDRFELVISGMEMEGSKSGTDLPPPLSEKSIIGIARKFNGDAVLALESFDSDSRNTATGIVESESILRTGVDPINYPNNVRSGWRLYHGKTGQILDEFRTYVTPGGWWAYVDQPAHVNRRQAVEGADISAYQMAGRLIPVEVQYERRYFKNSGLFNKGLKRASKFVKAGRMEKAGEIWQEIYFSDASRKSRGRAAYNLALLYESLSDFDEAIMWIDRAIDLNARKATQYGALLSERQ